MTSSLEKKKSSVLASELKRKMQLNEDLSNASPHHKGYSNADSIYNSEKASREGDSNPYQNVVNDGDIKMFDNGKEVRMRN